MTKLVTIGIPTYNRPDGLRKLLETIVNQTYQNIEIIISDNCSTDENVQKVIEEFAANDDRIQATTQKENIGIMENFAFVLDQAKGMYFMWAADDDFFDLETVEHSVHGFSMHDDLVVSGLNSKICNRETQRITYPELFPNTLSKRFFEKYASIEASIQEGINLYYYSLYHTETLRKCSYYYKPCFGADQYLLFEMLHYGEIYINKDQYGLNYSQHENQSSVDMLRYREMFTGKASWFQKKFFFSFFLFNHITLLFKNGRISFVIKLQISGVLIRNFFKNKNFHLIKYDLGLANLLNRRAK